MVRSAVSPVCRSEPIIGAGPRALRTSKDSIFEAASPQAVPAWEYDEEARKAHDIEVEEQEKADAQARKEARKKLKEAKIRQKMNEIRNEKK